MKMNNTHIAEIEEQISTRVLKFANKRVSSKKQVDKAGQKEGLKNGRSGCCASTPTPT